MEKTEITIPSKWQQVISHDNNNDDNDEELGINDVDELVGQLVDYVSDLALLS